MLKPKNPTGTDLIKIISHAKLKSEQVNEVMIPYMFGAF